MYFNEIWGNCGQISDKTVDRILFSMCHIVEEPVSMEGECILGEILGEGLSRSLCGHYFYRSCLFLLVVFIVFMKRAYSRENIYFHFFSISVNLKSHGFWIKLHSSQLRCTSVKSHENVCLSCLLWKRQ